MSLFCQVCQLYISLLAPANNQRYKYVANIYCLINDLSNYHIIANSSSANSAYLSVPFDLGGMIGGVFAGYVVDRTGASAITCIIMLLLAIPSVSKLSTL